jgi:dienelactone hydrolase
VLMAGFRPGAAADHVIDGVPLPQDATVGTGAASGNAIQRQWIGAWFGLWDGVLKHILLVESVDDDGSARVVYATGDNPVWGTQRHWRRYKATATEAQLTIADSARSIVYDKAGPNTSRATYTRGSNRGRALLAKADFPVSPNVGTVVDWTAGKSEFLQTDLVEDARAIRLEVVVFKPAGAGPWPLAVINHGSTGDGRNPALFTATWFDIGLADYLNERGWLVAFPQRRGRGKSNGRYDEGFSPDRERGYARDADRSLAGAERALHDLDAALAALRSRSDVIPSRVLLGGQSRGGVLSVAYAGDHPEHIFGVINFVGGWLSDGNLSAKAINETLFARGGRFGRPTLWLYGAKDPFYSIAHSRQNFAAFEKAGGHGTFVEYDVPGGYGHGVIAYPQLWSGSLDNYLGSLGANKGPQRR